jgi:hypothetical protein
VHDASSVTLNARAQCWSPAKWPGSRWYNSIPVDVSCRTCRLPDRDAKPNCMTGVGLGPLEQLRAARSPQQASPAFSARAYIELDPQHRLSKRHTPLLSVGRAIQQSSSHSPKVVRSSPPWKTQLWPGRRPSKTQLAWALNPPTPKPRLRLASVWETRPRHPARRSV